MKGKALALLLLLGLAALAAPVARADDAEVVEDEDDDPYADVDESSAFLLVRRKLSDDMLQVGKMVNVLIEIHNAGSADAKKVSVKDQAWPAEVFHTEGQLEAEYDSIPAGTTQSFTYSISPKAPQRVQIHPILVSYVPAEDSKPIEATTGVVVLQVYTATQVLQVKALQVGSTVTMGLFTTEQDWMRSGVILAGVAVAYVLMGLYKKAAKVRAQSRSRNALKALGLTEEDMKTK